MIALTPTPRLLRDALMARDHFTAEYRAHHVAVRAMLSAAPADGPMSESDLDTLGRAVVGMAQAELIHNLPLVTEAVLGTRNSTVIPNNVYLADFLRFAAARGVYLAPSPMTSDALQAVLDVCERHSPASLAVQRARQTLDEAAAHIQQATVVVDRNQAA